MLPRHKHPLIVPASCAKAYDLFMLRQFFMTIRFEPDDQAKIDGANAIQTIFYVTLPKAKPALITLVIFHFLYAWNDFDERLTFLHTREHWTPAVGLQTINALYTTNHHLICQTLS